MGGMVRLCEFDENLTRNSRVNRVQMDGFVTIQFRIYSWFTPLSRQFYGKPKDGYGRGGSPLIYSP